ncbi:MAG: hypothetical protein LBH74_02500 [Nitrososphaerota archaeon]|nr:hypothetical protein [Nitrososphaerota archaeon]
MVFNRIKKYYGFYDNPKLLLSLPISKRSMVLKALVLYSNFMGEGDLFKAKYKSFGIKWGGTESAINGFLSMISQSKNDLPQYIQDIRPLLHHNEQLYIRFLAVTGMRPREGMEAFNLIIKLSHEGRLNEYYNESLQCLEHYNFREIFFRRTKNSFISFVDAMFIKDIAAVNSPVNYNRIQCCLKRNNKPIKLKQLRSYHNTFLYKRGIQSELIDMISGRVSQTVFSRHYLTVNLKEQSPVFISAQEACYEAIMKNPAL